MFFCSQMKKDVPNYYDYFDGVKISTCSTPCLSTQVHNHDFKEYSFYKYFLDIRKYYW